MDEIISEYGGVIMLLAVGKIVVESLVRILGIVTGMYSEFWEVEMKEILEEYGMVVVAIVVISVIFVAMFKLRQMYWVAQMIFLGGIGG